MVGGAPMLFLHLGLHACFVLVLFGFLCICDKNLRDVFYGYSAALEDGSVVTWVTRNQKLLMGEGNGPEVPDGHTT